MATVKTDSLILVVVLRQNEGYNADVSSCMGLSLMPAVRFCGDKGSGPLIFARID
jgi:hypothetical protein